MPTRASLERTIFTASAFSPTPGEAMIRPSLPQSSTGPYVVLHAFGPDNDRGEALLLATPKEARKMAKALLDAADLAEEDDDDDI